MLYNMLSQERMYTKPARFADKRRNCVRRMKPVSSVMTFSVREGEDAAWTDSSRTSPVYMADRARCCSASPIPTSPAIGSMDTGRVPTVSRDGVKLPALLTMLVLLALVFGGIKLGYHVGISDAAKQTSANMSAMRLVQRSCEDAELEIAQCVSEINISTSAIEMGMISSRGVDVIYLSAPEGATYIVPADSILYGEYRATNQGD